MPAPPVADELLVPVVTPEAAGFWDACAEGRLTIQTCEACGVGRFPPGPTCSSCRSTRARWAPVSGRGTVWSFVVPRPPLLPAYEAMAPYVVAVVELDDDPRVRMVGLLVDASGAPIGPGEVAIGVPVEVDFAGQGGLQVPRWTTVADGPTTTEPPR